MSEGRKVFVVNYENGVTLHMTGRWRLAGGTKAHLASVSAPDEKGGRFVVIFCDTGRVMWIAHEEIERLSLMLDPDDNPVTCKACLTAMEKAA